MSDALCGPSNPLQQFKQQTQFDRTLQQDRLTSRQSPSQGFRSANPNAGLLDPEFEAFQAGFPPSDLPFVQPSQPPGQYHGGPMQAPSWAADFQQMHISSSPPFQQQRMPQPGPSTANWAQGFRDHVAQTTPRAQTSASSPQQFQQMARFGGGMNGFQSNFGQSHMTPSMQSKGKEPAAEQFDEAAFERAFDQARDDMVDGTELEHELRNSGLGGQRSEVVTEPRDYKIQSRELEEANIRSLRAAQEEQLRHSQSKTNTANVQQSKNAQQSSTLQDSQDELMTLAEQDSQLKERIGEMQDPHQIREEAMEEQAEAQERATEDDDALAATAQELLEKVQHNQTDKFRNSQFLGLMRKLRDREVKVEGDKMVETNNVRSSPSHLQLPPAPTSHPDLLSASRGSTPASILDGFKMPRTPPEFDTHFELGWPEVEHDLDHWESPYR